MRLFCKHVWKVHTRIVAPAFDMSNITKLGGCSEYMAERMMFGVTTVLLICVDCKELRKEEMLGTSVLK